MASVASVASVTSVARVVPSLAQVISRAFTSSAHQQARGGGSSSGNAASSTTARWNQRGRQSKGATSQRDRPSGNSFSSSRPQALSGSKHHLFKRAQDDRPSSFKRSQDSPFPPPSNPRYRDERSSSYTRSSSQLDTPPRRASQDTSTFQRSTSNATSTTRSSRSSDQRDRPPHQRGSSDDRQSDYYRDSKPGHREGKPAFREAKPDYREGKSVFRVGKPGYREGKPGYGSRQNDQMSTPRTTGSSRDRSALPPTTSRRLAEFPNVSDRRGAPQRPRRSPTYTPSTERSGGSVSSFPPPTKSVPVHRQEANVELAQSRPFSAFDIHPGLLSALADKYGVDGKTTAIQSLALARLITSSSSPDPNAQGHPVRAVLGAETGSGKTLAYLLPLLHHLKATDRGRDESVYAQLNPRALVFSPTHELTRQSTAVAKSLTHTAKLSVLGASSPGSLRERTGIVDVVFGTGRSIGQMVGIGRDGEDSEPTVALDHLDWIVIDEADVLLGPDFADETVRVLARVSQARPNVNVLLVTATLPPSLLHHLETDKFFSSHPFIQLLSPGIHRLPRKLETRFVPWSGSGNPLADVAHEIKRVFAEDAFDAKLIDESTKSKSKAVVFCGSLNKVDALAKMLESKGVSCLAWTGESAQRQAKLGHNGPLDVFLTNHKAAPNPETLSQQQQQHPTVHAARSSNDTPEPRVLITTSLLSRGLDFSPAVTTSYLLDPPRNVLDFVHRAGRAGRAGRPGRVVVFGLSHAGQTSYGDELKGVLGKAEHRVAVKPGGRTWSARRE